MEFLFFKCLFFSCIKVGVPFHEDTLFSTLFSIDEL